MLPYTVIEEPTKYILLEIIERKYLWSTRCIIIIGLLISSRNIGLFDVRLVIIFFAKHEISFSYDRWDKLYLS